MDKLEYIPGDIVKYLGQPVMIRRYHNEYNLDLLYNHRIQDKNIPISKIYPIRLTDSILRKNGWYDRADLIYIWDGVVTVGLLMFMVKF